MAEDESTQDQEQPGSQGPASGSGLVSLDQARSIALDHARDNQDFYGRRYRRRELAWDVLGQEEREDAYHIRLSYQPARGFRGDPGVEQFIIERSGAVQSRRIVSEPRRRGGLPGCGLMAAGVLVLVAMTIAGLLGSVL